MTLDDATMTALKVGPDGYSICRTARGAFYLVSDHNMEETLQERSSVIVAALAGNLDGKDIHKLSTT